MATEWHGYGLIQPDGTREALHIGPMRGRKAICLYIVSGVNGYPLAYFRSAADARRALAFIERLAATRPDGVIT